MITLKLDQSEIVLLHEYLRQTRNAPEYGAEHDRDFMVRLRKAFLVLETPELKGRTTNVEFSEGEIWQITRQISSQVMLGSRPIGLELLKKCWLALEQEENGNDDVPNAFRLAAYDDSGEDDGASHGTGEEIRAFEDLPSPGA